MTRGALLIPLAALLTAAGCAPKVVCEPPKPVVLPQVRAYHGADLVGGGRLRTLVLPFHHSDRAATASVTEAFALELAKAQHFEVLPPDGPEAAMAEQLGAWDGNALDVHALTVLRQRLRVDALICGRILRHRAYSPPILGVRVQAVSTRTGGVLWGAEGTFDAGAQYLMTRFHDLWLEDAPRSLGWKVLLHSPRLFNQFVAHQLVASIEPTEIPTLAATPKP